MLLWYGITSITEEFSTVDLKMIQIEEIVKFINGFSRPLEGSRQILNSGYLQKVGAVQESDDCVHLRGLCFRVHKPDETVTINIKISKPFPGEVVSGQCTCIAGQLGKCKHAVAVLRYAERCTSCEPWSCTDGTAAWKEELKKVRDIIATPVPLTEFCHGIQTRKGLFPKIPNFFDSEIFGNIKDKIPKNCMFWKEFIGRGTRTYVDNVVQQKTTVDDTNALLCDFGRDTFPCKLSNLYNSLYEECTYEELISIARSMNFDIRADLISEVEERTRQQAKSEEWHQVRRGRITGYIMKEMCCVRSSTSNRTLIQKICHGKKVVSPAIIYGKNNEERAKNAYFENQRFHHSDLVIEERGFFIFETQPYIGASPDGLIECNCCGRGVLEIKCPYSLREGGSVHSLSYVENGKLKRNHEYFYQVQTEMMCTHSLYGDFCIWTPFELYIERIYFDEEFCHTMCLKAGIFFHEAIMPELLARYFTRNPAEPRTKRTGNVNTKKTQNTRKKATWKKSMSSNN